MVLVNGSEGIGTGWSTRVPNHDIRQLISNCKRMMDGEEPLPIVSDGSLQYDSVNLLFFLIRRKLEIQMIPFFFYAIF